MALADGSSVPQQTFGRSGSRDTTPAALEGSLKSDGSRVGLAGARHPTKGDYVHRGSSVHRGNVLEHGGEPERDAPVAHLEDARPLG
jgi:hypothetical protein